MAYDKAVIKVLADHEGIVEQVKELANELHDPEKFIVRVVDESNYTEGTGVDGSKI